jgi:hypothetical protein
VLKRHVEWETEIQENNNPKTELTVACPVLTACDDLPAGSSPTSAARTIDKARAFGCKPRPVEECIVDTVRGLISLRILRGGVRTSGEE